MTALASFQLLEINLISAQDLAKVSRSMKTYAMAWVHPKRKLTTRVDTKGAVNPTWNDKFVFRVDNKFTKSDTSAIMIEIYALHWFRDVHVGTVRVLVGNLVPPQTRGHNMNHIGMRFAALQVRRSSGQPQGILNIGITVLDSTRRSMPLCSELGESGVGFQKLMGYEDLHSHGNRMTKGSKPTQAQLRRSMSEKSSMLEYNKPNSSIINMFEKGPMIRNTKNKENMDRHTYDKPLSIIDGGNSSLAIQLKSQKGKADSVLSYNSSFKLERRKSKKKGLSSFPSRSDIGSIPPLLRHVSPHQGKVRKGPKKPATDVGVGERKSTSSSEIKTNILHKNIRRRRSPFCQHHQRGQPITKDFTAGSVWTESEVGPSPSEVAAAIAEDRKYIQYEDGRISVMDDMMSMAESEGMMTKLERWQAQAPPPYDYDCQSSDGASSIFPTKQKHRRRHTVAGDGKEGGKFSCFGKICGCECSIVCGKDNEIKDHRKIRNKRRGAKKRVGRAPSLDSVSTYS